MSSWASARYAGSVTQRLYYEDPYRMQFDARVLSAEAAEQGVAVVLDRTCFYPGGGGQPADRGSIDGIPVGLVRERVDGLIEHVLERAPAGGQVSGAVDQRWRLDFMAQHTGQHLLSASLLASANLATVSVHFGEEATTIEVAAEKVDDGALGQAEALANRVVRENRRVRCRELPRAEALQLPLRRKPPEGDPLRIVEIEGLDTAACGGVHVATTGEIFMVKLTVVERIRGRLRIHALMGERAFADYGRKVELGQALSRLLTCGEADIMRRVEELATRERDAARELKRLRVAEAAGLADAAVAEGVEVSVGPARARFVGRVFEGIGESAVNAFVDRVLAAPGRLAAVADRSADGFRWTVAHSLGDAVDLRGALSATIAALGLRGGGRNALVKGSGRDPGSAVEFLEAVRKALAP